MKKIILASFLFLNCGGSGTVNVTAYGEAFIEQGISSDDFADGYAVSFSEFSVTFADISLAKTSLTKSVTLDLVTASNGAGQTIGSITPPPAVYSDLSFSITKVVMKGTANKAGVTKSFDWTFTDVTHYGDCESKTAVTAGSTTTTQITVHADHFFYDSLVSEEPNLRFQALADADSNADGAITEQELRAASLGTYDPGNATPSNLWAYLGLLAQNLGHVDGEGHCEASASR